MRNLGLDILRMVAILLVLVGHLHLEDDTHFALKIRHKGGWIGVDLFFVLSGFLVSSLIFREYQRSGRVDYKRFLIRRGFKIYPAFWVYLLFTTCMIFVLKIPFSPRRFVGELLFSQNYLGSIAFGHTWSLAVEEHFYLGIAALFAWWTWRQPNHQFKQIPRMCLAVSLVCLSFRLLNLVIFPEYSHKAYLFGTHIRIDSLFFGVLLSYYYVFHDLNEKLAFIPTWLLFVTGGLLLSPAYFFAIETHRWIPTVGLIVFYLGSGMLLLGALRFPDSNFLPLKLLGVLGASSYSIYLWHMPVNVWGWPFIQRVTGLDGLPSYFLFYVVGSCLLGLVMSRIIEFPALHLRDRLFPSYASATSVMRHVAPAPNLQQPTVQTSRLVKPGALQSITGERTPRTPASNRGDSSSAL